MTAAYHQWWNTAVGTVLAVAQLPTPIVPPPIPTPTPSGLAWTAYWQPKAFFGSIFGDIYDGGRAQIGHQKLTTIGEALSGDPSGNTQG